MKKFRCDFCKKKFHIKRKAIVEFCLNTLCKKCAKELELCLLEEYEDHQKELYNDWQESVRQDIYQAMFEQRFMKRDFL